MSGKDRADNGKYVETTPTEEVLDTVRDADDPIVTVGDVAGAVNCSRETARRKLTELHTDGWVERREVGASAVVWWVPNDGKTTSTSRHGDDYDGDTPDASMPTKSFSDSSHEQAFETFAKRASDAVGEEIHEIILFGSTARGEPRGIDSDVDVFVVVETMDVKDTLDEIAYQAMHEHGVVVSLIIKTVDVVENNADHLFLKNVRREGRMADRPQESIQRARQALATASVAQESGDVRAALNRLYYACFHAARAMLYEREFEPSKHSAVLSLFDRELVHDGDVQTEHSKTLRDLFDQRQDADYGFGPVTGDVERLSRRAAEFVDRMDELLDAEPLDGESVDGDQYP